MEILIHIPDEIADHMIRKEHDPARELLELSVLSALRHGRIFESEAASLLGMESRFQLWEWLKQIDPSGGLDTVDSVEEQVAVLADARSQTETTRSA